MVKDISMKQFCHDHYLIVGFIAFVIVYAILFVYAIKGADETDYDKY